jgi:intracellular sulfur oxidation DsrE/DsrF family protein
MKKHDQGISDEFLNAFVDDQLDGDEKSHTFDAIEQDDALKERVCELRGLKERMRHAYEHPPVRGRAAVKGRRLRASHLQALAACLLLCIGGASGWFAHTWTGMGGDREMTRMLQSVQRNDVGVEPQKIIVHVGSSNPVRLKTALDETENLLDSYRRSNRQLQVEIVANGGGVDLLRADVSPYAKRIGLMQEKYPNLGFLACGQTIQKLQDKGVDVKLLPHTAVASSAVDQITLRLKQDWVYIRV